MKPDPPHSGPGILPETMELFDPITAKTFTVRKPVEVAPGVFDGAVEFQNLPKDAGIVRFALTADGKWKPQMTFFGSHIAMCANIGEKLGIQGRNVDQTIRRLMASGFIAYAHPSPGLYLINLHSLARHWRVSAKPGFWTPERIARFRGARAALKQISLDETAAAYADEEIS